MRTRLTVAILALVAGTLLLAGAGGILLVHRSNVVDTEQQLYQQAKAAASLPADDLLGAQCCLAGIRDVGGYRNLTVATVSPDGTISGLPPDLAGVDLRPGVLQSDRSVAGSHGGLVYVAVPLFLTLSERQQAQPPIPANQLAVLVATRTLRSPVTGLLYFAFVSLVALAVATGVAYWLASRFSRPLAQASAVTARLAAGDLEARMPVDPGERGEFAALATAINSMADSLERARNQQRQFLLSVSHDLRTPLTSIRGYAEALADGTTTDVPGAVAVIAAEADRLERLVADLLDLARLDARRFSLHPAPVDLAQAVRSSVGIHRPGAARAGLDLAPALPGDGPVWVTADPDRVAQILSNLVENAFRFARAKVVVGARADGPTALLWVVDDGPGIAPTDLGRVFEPHFSSDAGGHRRGSGLGLAIVAELAAAMGGAVRADSPATPEGGTRLTVSFPTGSAVQANSGSQGAVAASSSSVIETS